MNSKERREKRYLRRVAIRKSNNEIRNIIYGNIKDAFNFENVYLNAKKCTRNVGYKKKKGFLKVT